MPVELIAIVLGAVLLLIILNVLPRPAAGLNQAYYQKKWGEIRLLLKTSAAGARLSVIEADKLLDHALKDLKFTGETMADRLKSAGVALGNKDGVWDAHRLRNRLVHEDVHPRPNQIKSTLRVYETCLKKLGAL